MERDGGLSASFERIPDTSLFSQDLFELEYHSINISSVLKTIRLGCRDPYDLPAYKDLIKHRKLEKRKLTADEKLHRNFMRAFPMMKAVFGNLLLPIVLRKSTAASYRDCIINGLTNGRETFMMLIAISEIKCEEFNVVRNVQGLVKGLNTDLFEPSNTKEIRIETIGKYSEIIKGVAGNELRHRMLRKALFKGLEKLDIDDYLKIIVPRVMEQAIMYNFYSRKKPEVAAALMVMSTSEQLGFPMDRNEIAHAFGVSERNLRRSG